MKIHQAVKTSKSIQVLFIAEIDSFLIKKIFVCFDYLSNLVCYESALSWLLGVNRY